MNYGEFLNAFVHFFYLKLVCIIIVLQLKFFFDVSYIFGMLYEAIPLFTLAIPTTTRNCGTNFWRMTHQKSKIIFECTQGGFRATLGGGLVSTRKTGNNRLKTKMTLSRKIFICLSIW